jgi:hypothetical protein
VLSTSPKTGFLTLEKELQGERAGALGRMGATLERLIDEASALERALPLNAEARERALRQHELVRQEAEKYLWYLIVTREAMGLRLHEDVYAAYPLPPRLTR